MAVSRLRPAALLLLGAVTACSAAPLPAEEVAGSAEEALHEDSGVRPEVTCAEDLAVEVGARTRCTMTVADDPAEYGVRITVDAVDDDRVHVDVEVEDHPSG